MAISATVPQETLHIPAAYGALPSHWAWARLDDFCNGVYDCPHSTPRLTSTGPYVVRTQDIATGTFRPEQAARVSDETFLERTTRATPRYGDLLYSREGTYFGVAAEVPKGFQVCLGQRMVLIRPNPRLIDFRYLCYWLNSPLMATHIHGFRDGSVAERLNLPTIRSLPVVVPSLAEQRSIASTLRVLDDKVEWNRRVASLLSDLVSTSFTDLITRYREYEPLSTLATFHKGVSYRSADLSPSTTAMVTLKSFDRNGGYKQNGLKQFVGKYKPEQKVDPGELVVAQTDLTQAAEVVGQWP
ncbi:MAG TPA: restriction endonuclease subunit S [Pseudonocardiaceae bacterium]|jgi:type I restriction enzyme S subunit|nr:restriction endonuclease subunit S [Pseudonocardiaceae bacterium]